MCMQIVANEAQLRRYLKTALEIGAGKPVLVDKYIEGKEVEVDAVCDGTDVFVPGIMEKSAARLAEAGVQNVSLTDFDTVVGIAAQEGIIAPEDKARLLAFRNNPTDESWVKV